MGSKSQSACTGGMPNAHDILLRVRQLDGRALQGPLQLHRAAPRPAAAADLQRLLRQDGALLEERVRGGPANLHLPAANKPVHGRPRLHDGKYGHWSHVFL